MNKNNSNFSLFDLLNNQPQMFRGVVWMLLATFAAACQNSLVKFVSDDLPVVEMLLVRSLISLSIFLPVVIKTGFEPVKTNRLGFHCFRGGVHSLAQLLFFYALAVTPLATVAALNFTGPLFSTLMAALFLGEVIRARRITAMAIGFAGAMVILRPGFIEMDLGAVATIVSAFFWGGSLVCMKVLSRTESSLTITLYGLFFSILVSLVLSIPVWITPTLEQMGWLLAIGVFNALSQITRTQAIKEADISIIMPLDFTRLIWVSIFGYLLFGEVPDGWIWFGGILIFASATYIAYRQRQVKQTQE
ncbi:MAG: DMT family transporter [Rhodospirillaceae bacterium]|jgi:drug/metabolite transporter (DMT)-like permease